MNKKIFYSETSYVIGLIALAVGTSLMEKADLGMSMVVAPAYLIYLKLSATFSFLTFGMAGYLFQALLLLVLVVVVRKFRVSYLFAFVTSVLYGMTLDLSIFLMQFITADSMTSRLIYYCAGLLFCSAGVSLFFHTYIAPEVYELFVKEVSAKYGFRLDRCKTSYDCISCIFAVIMSFAFFGFGNFQGVKIGTIFCALVNGFLIGKWSYIFESKFEFRDKFRNQGLTE